MDLIFFYQNFNAETQRRRVRRVFYGCLRQGSEVRGQYAGVRSWSSELELESGGVKSRRGSEGPSERIRRIRRGSARRSLRPPTTTTFFGDRPHDRPKNQGSDGVCPQFLGLGVSRNNANRERGFFQNDDRMNTKALLPTSPLPRSKCHWSESSFPVFATH